MEETNIGKIDCDDNLKESDYIAGYFILKEQIKKHGERFDSFTKINRELNSRLEIQCEEINELKESIIRLVKKM